jgi:hypothetical protein
MVRAAPGTEAACQTLVANLGREVVPWLLSIEVDGQPMYWTGRKGRHGGPQRTLWKGDAKLFTTPRAAYECADTHAELKDSDQWKVIQR